MDMPLPLIRDVVLIGGGHTHALVLRKWSMKPVPGARLTLINPEPAAPYTGMLPGHVAGHYTRDELDYDLVKLCRFAGARLILGYASAIDREARLIEVEGRPPVAYDIASLDIGITSELPTLEGFESHGVPAKPLGGFARAWRTFLEGEDTQVAVIGGGVGGVELALAMEHALRQRGRSPAVSVIDRDEMLSALAPAPRRRLIEECEAKSIDLIGEAEVAALQQDGVRLADGRMIASAFTVTATGARPYDWLRETGLDLVDGFVSVGADLRTSDPAIFAAGDCAHLSHAPRPKAGVFAVRAAPVLDANIRAALTGGEATAFRPQRSYLKLISLGEKQAILDKWGLGLSGGWAWDWKDRIDRKFMGKLSNLPAMDALKVPDGAVDGMAEALGPKPLCGGCGAKVGGGVLDDVLAGLAPVGRTDVETAAGDDAAVLMIGGARQVVTTDHLRAFWEDPVVMTRIAAMHALGDAWSMGAAPQAALAQITLPRMSDDLQRRTLTEIMMAAHGAFAEAGAEIVGGHTTQGAEMQIGFTVTGLVERAVTQGGARAGDVVVLTKGVGTGVVMAGEMVGKARGRDVAAALASMSEGQAEVARALAQVATAMTDVTGFGLAGHAWRIARASGVRMVLDVEAVPLLDGALGLAEAGVRSSLFAANLSAVPGAIAMTAREELMFDPQTSGGFLATVPEGEVEGLVREWGVRVIGQCEVGEAEVILC